MINHKVSAKKLNKVGYFHDDYLDFFKWFIGEKHIEREDREGSPIC